MPLLSLPEAVIGCASKHHYIPACLSTRTSQQTLCKEGVSLHRKRWRSGKRFPPMNSVRIAGVPENELLQWIRSSVSENKNILSRGYQGQTFIFQGNDARLVIKAPSGSGLVWFIRRWMLANEHRVYQMLTGIDGIPRCYGFLQNRYLILEYIEGTPIRQAQIEDPEFFFKALLQLIQHMHAAGVAHGDLKKKDNTLVVQGKHPYVVDFGVAAIRKKRMAPLNRYLFHLFRQFDTNAWVKLKYNGRVRNMTPEDRVHYQRTFVEYAASWIKESYRKARKLLIGR
jgi:predicted Ser/Thr protein kinase